MQLTAFALAATLLAALPVAAETAVSSTLLRTAIFVKDRPATVAFYCKVMGYEDIGTAPIDSFAEAMGLPADAKVTLTTLKSKDGAGLSIMGVESSNFGLLNRPKGIVNASGDIMLVHQVTGISEIHTRAVTGHYTVLMAPKLSRTGKSMQMFLRDPNGVRIELYELLPTAK